MATVSVGETRCQHFQAGHTLHPAFPLVRLISVEETQILIAALDGG